MSKIKSKVKVNLIKGPNFKHVEKKAYGLLHSILLEKEIQAQKEKNKKDGEAI